MDLTDKSLTFKRVSLWIMKYSKPAEKCHFCNENYPKTSTDLQIAAEKKLSNCRREETEMFRYTKVKHGKKAKIKTKECNIDRQKKRLKSTDKTVCELSQL